MFACYPARRRVARRLGPAGAAEVRAMPPAGPGQPVLTAEAVFRLYAPRIDGLARRLLHNEADAEDVTQDVLLQVVRKLDTFRGEAEFTTWLHRVTVNMALAHRRRGAPRLAREVRAPLEEVEGRGRLPSPRPPEAGPVHQVLGREARALIEQAVARLPEMYRQPFVLVQVEGLSYATVGAALGLSAAAVKTRLHRARLLLRAALGRHFPEGAAGREMGPKN
jgi:RNA polymerase sigma-70 factor (ECF subfamily)